MTTHADGHAARSQRLGEVVRFGIVGALATAIQYGLYWLLIHHGGQLAHSRAWPTVAMTVAYAVSFAFNFMASTRYTFRVKANARRGAGFALSHVVNYLLQMAVLNAALWAGLPRQWAPVPMFAVCVPVNFLLVRFFLKRG